MMKREAELLLERIISQSNAMQGSIEYLADPCFEKTPDEVVKLLNALDDRMRLQQLDAARVLALSQADSEAMQMMFAQTVQIVGALRDGDCIFSLKGIAYIQQTLNALFPGDVLED